MERIKIFVGTDDVVEESVNNWLEKHSDSGKIKVKNIQYLSSYIHHSENRKDGGTYGCWKCVATVLIHYKKIKL